MHTTRFRSTRAGPRHSGQVTQTLTRGTARSTSFMVEKRIVSYFRGPGCRRRANTRPGAVTLQGVGFLKSL